MAERGSGFWSTLPGILTGIAAVITASTGFYLAFVRQPGGASPTSAATSPPAALAEPAPLRPGDAEVRATVIDPDGWTNLRSAPSTSAAVVGRVREGEVFWTRPSDGLWWPSRTEAGLTGYVHRSRVRLNP